MDKLDYQKLMEQTFKSNFIINLLTNLYAKEITKEDYIKMENVEIIKENEEEGETIYNHREYNIKLFKKLFKF